jgi:hypothetical protein
MDIRARLRVKIAEQGKRRGRSLIDRERLANLCVALDRPLTIEECEAEMASAGIVPTPAPMPFERQPEN